MLSSMKRALTYAIRLVAVVGRHVAVDERCFDADERAPWTPRPTPTEGRRRARNPDPND
jgi:hypothetical protein